jgi:hypothetical protein
VNPRAGLDDVKKRKFLTPPGLELQSLGRPVCIQSLYRLRYPGSIPYFPYSEKKKKEAYGINLLSVCGSVCVSAPNFFGL